MDTENKRAAALDVLIGLLSMTPDDIRIIRAAIAAALDVAGDKLPDEWNTVIAEGLKSAKMREYLAQYEAHRRGGWSRPGEKVKPYPETP